MSSGRMAFVLCTGVIAGGLVGFQVQAYLLDQARRKEQAFIDSEVERKVEEWRLKQQSK